MKYLRGFIGLGLMAVGIAMIFNEKTRSASWLLLGFGIGMASSGF